MLSAITIEGGPVLVLVRGAADAALLSAFGAALGQAWLAPPVLDRLADGGAIARRLARVVWLSLAAGALLTVLWLIGESAELSGSVGGTPVVLWFTLFGHLILLKLGLLGVAALWLRRDRFWFGAVAAGMVVALQAGHGHALAMDEGPGWLLASSVLHLVAAGAWLGGLVPLLVLVASVPPGLAVFASRRFSLLGTVCVAVLAGTAFYQGSVLVGSVPGWIGTGYGLVTLGKTGLFLLLLGFAARNRFRLSPALVGGMAEAARAGLVRSIAAEAGAGLVVVLAAGLLTSLPPAMHEQPNWPFPWRFSLDAVQEDGSLRQEALLAGVTLAAAVIAAAAAFTLRLRFRIVVLLCAAVAAKLAVPHLDLLLAEAYPTQYWRSPTGFASSSIAEGGMLYPSHCAACHGAQGRGDGVSASGLPVPPADLTAEHLWAHADGELFWWVSHGIEAPGGELAMPGFAGTLTERERWAVIDWVRANNAGMARAGTGSWPRPVQAPGFQARCGGGRTVTLDELRGRVVRLVFGSAVSVPGVVTVQVGPDGAARSGEGLCVVGDAAVPFAYGAVAGLAPEQLAGVQVLIDGDGWLRELHMADVRPGWGEPGVLAGAVEAIRSHPVSAVPAGHAGMRM